MTLTNTNRISVHPGNGIATEFTYTFPIFEATDVIVFLQDAVTGETTNTLLPTEYTITGLGNQAGGSVLYPLSGTPVASTHNFVIERIVPLTQDAALANYGGFYPEAIEEQLDRIVMQTQQLSTGIDRAIKMPVGSTGYVFEKNIADGEVLMKQGNSIVPGPDAADIASAQTNAAAAAQSAAAAEAWAEGTLPGGVDTKSAKEWALVAQSAVTYNRAAVRGTINAGVGPYDAGVAIGSVNNIDIKVGGVIFDHDLYTISGTTFTFLTDPGTGLPWEAVVQSDVCMIGSPSDGTVFPEAFSTQTIDYLDTRYQPSSIITADMAPYNAVFDGTPEDHLRIKDAALAAVAAGVPFVVPTQGYFWADGVAVKNEGLVIQVPEDFATVQEAHDAMLNWIFLGTPPKQGDTTQNHVYPMTVTISVSAEEHIQNGKNITWTHPRGDVIRLQGRGKTTLTLASQQALTFSSGVHLLRLRFTNWPTVDPYVGGTLRILAPDGSGEFQNFEGAWRITAVDPVNKDITIAVWLRSDASVVASIISSGLFIYLPCQLRFINQPYSGADVGGIDVHTCLRISDIALSGNSAGTNASSTDGIFAREGSKVLFDQHCAVLEFQRSGLWVLNSAYAQIGYTAFCGNNSGINNLQGVIDGTNAALQGNLTYNYIGGIGSSASIVQTAFGGAGSAGILVNGNASLICSGNSRRSPYGVLCWPGGFVNINDMNVRVNTITDVCRHKSGRILLTANDSGTFKPALGTGDSFGGFTALTTTLVV